MSSVFLSRVSLLCSFAVVVAAQTGCDDSSNLNSVTPDLEADPEPGSWIDFDELIYGELPVDPRYIRIGNVGEGPLVFQQASLRGQDADQFRVTSVPETLAPGAEGRLYARFEPTVTGTLTADLVLLSNDPDESEVVWKLRGAARDPCDLEASPPHHLFALGDIRTVTLKTAGTYRCVVTSLSVDAALFTLVNLPSLPLVLEPGETFDLQVQLTGTTLNPGAPIRQLRVRERDGSEVTVSLQGETPLYGCLSVSPERLVFPTTPVSQTAERVVSVRNDCSEEAIVGGANVGIGYYAFAALGTFPRIIQPRETIDITIRYSPLFETGDFGVVNIVTNDARIPYAPVSLEGRAASVILEAFPTKVDFGTVAYRSASGGISECSSATRIVQMFSLGAADAHFSGLEITASSDPSFRIASATVEGQPIDPTSSFTLTRGEELRVSLVFNPGRASPAEHSGVLVARHDGEGGQTRFELVGTAGLDGPVEDRFTQLDGPMADILWVIDNSCSMFDEQARLISNLTPFVGYADSVQSDYRMAVVTTDAISSRGGLFERCFPHPSIVASDYADAATREAAFRCMFEVGTDGNGNYEAGLGAAKRALERSLDPTLENNPNFGFLRDDADLVIVAVSDEDDQSYEPDTVLRDYFFSLKGNRRSEKVKVHAIAYPVTEACVPAGNFGAPGYGYSWMARETGGLFFNLCDQDWQPILQNLGLDAFTPLSSWELSQQADPASLQVSLDGASIPEDPTNGYTYDPSSNVVQFWGTSVPPPGADVRVRYLGLCRP